MNPPPGGSVVRDWVQPGAALGGIGTVVATAEGAVEAVVEVEVEVEGPDGNLVAEACPILAPGADVPDEHALNRTARTARETGRIDRLFATCLPCLARCSSTVPVVAQG